MSRGRLIEMALYDCGLTICSYYGLDDLLQGHDAPRIGNAHPSIVPYGMFEAADGPLIIAVGNNSQFERFCREVINRPDIPENPDYKTNLDRAIHRETLIPLVLAEIKARKRADLLERLHARLRRRNLRNPSPMPLALARQTSAFIAK